MRFGMMQIDHNPFEGKVTIMHLDTVVKTIAFSKNCSDRKDGIRINL